MVRRLKGGALLVVDPSVCAGEQQQRPGRGSRPVAGQVRRRHQPTALARQRGHPAQVVQGQVQASQIRPVLGLRWSHVHRYSKIRPLLSFTFICIDLFSPRPPSHPLPPKKNQSFFTGEGEIEVWLMKKERR